LDGARLYAFLTENGIELRGGPQSDDSTHIPLDRVPIGHVRIEDSTVTVRDLRTTEPAWKVDRVSIDLERDPQMLSVAAQVRLPDALASRVSADVALRGDLKSPAQLQWTSHLELKKASLAGGRPCCRVGPSVCPVMEICRRQWRAVAQRSTMLRRRSV
jgi:hypothetical protein